MPGKKELKKVTKNEKNEKDTDQPKSDQASPLPVENTDKKKDTTDKVKSSDVRIEMPELNVKAQDPTHQPHSAETKTHTRPQNLPQNLPQNRPSNNKNPQSALRRPREFTTMPRVNDEEFASTIIAQLQPAYQSDIESSLDGRKCCHKVASTFMTMEKVFLGISAIMVFLSTSSAVGTHGETVAFVGGALIVLAEVIAGFQVYAKKASQTKTKELNELLANSGLDFVMPDLTDDHYDVAPGNRRIPLSNGSNGGTGGINSSQPASTSSSVDRHTATI